MENVSRPRIGRANTQSTAHAEACSVIAELETWHHGIATSYTFLSPCRTHRLLSGTDRFCRCLSTVVTTFTERQVSVDRAVPCNVSFLCERPRTLGSVFPSFFLASGPCATGHVFRNLIFLGLVRRARHGDDLFAGRKVQKLPASFSLSELGAHQMAPSGVIAHWRSHRQLEPTFHSSSEHFALSCFCFLFLTSCVSPLLPLGLGFSLPRGYVRSLSCYCAGLLCTGSLGIAVIRRMTYSSTSPTASS